MSFTSDLDQISQHAQPVVHVVNASFVQVLHDPNQSILNHPDHAVGLCSVPGICVLQGSSMSSSISEYDLFSTDLAASQRLPSQGSSVGCTAELIPMPITPVIERWLQARAVPARLASKSCACLCCCTGWIRCALEHIACMRADSQTHAVHVCQDVPEHRSF